MATTYNKAVDYLRTLNGEPMSQPKSNDVLKPYRESAEAKAKKCVDSLIKGRSNKK